MYVHPPAKQNVRLAKNFEGFLNHNHHHHQSQVTDTEDRLTVLSLTRCNKDLGHISIVLRFKIHRGLVRLNFGQSIAGTEEIAFLHVPLRQRPGFHGGRERGKAHHQVVRQFRVVLPPRCRSTHQGSSADQVLPKALGWANKRRSQRQRGVVVDQSDTTCNSNYCCSVHGLQ